MANRLDFRARLAWCARAQPDLVGWRDGGGAVGPAQRARARRYARGGRARAARGDGALQTRDNIIRLRAGTEPRVGKSAG